MNRFAVHDSFFFHNELIMKVNTKNNKKSRVYEKSNGGRYDYI
jgi:hypothetical protein